MYKMIILDLDGTLLNDYKEVSRKNIEWIQKAYEEKGVISVIATGRPFGYANEICRKYGDCFAGYIIACNGAMIKDVAEDKYLHKVPFTTEEVLKIQEIYLEEKADYMMLYTENSTMAEARDEKSFQNSGVKENEKVESIGDTIKDNSSLTSLLCLIGGDVLALEKIKERVNLLEDIETSVICHYLFKTEKGSFESTYVDIMKKGCSKKNAIRILADKLGIKQEEIIVMGDGGNDLSMFECAGLKIAMENAEPYLKEKADFVTASNNDSGVARAIQKIIFGS